MDKSPQTYYKVTNCLEIHNGYVYKDGLNILDKPFEKEGTCVKGGLYFTKLKYIDLYYGFGVNLREVTLPDSDPDFLMVKDPEGKKYRANKIILGEKYSLFDPKTYKLFDLDVVKNTFLINHVSALGFIDVLNWWTRKRLPMAYDADALVLASQNGQIMVLDWWQHASRRFGLQLQYDNDAMTLASRVGQIAVLNWWKHSGLELKYDQNALMEASEMGQITVLNWWLTSNLELRYDQGTLISAATHGHDHVLDWWFSSGLELIYDEFSTEHSNKEYHARIMKRKQHFELNKFKIVKFNRTEL